MVLGPSMVNYHFQFKDDNSSKWAKAFYKILTKIEDEDLSLHLVTEKLMEEALLTKLLYFVEIAVKEVVAVARPDKEE